MKVGFRRSFVKDLERVRDASLKERLKETIAQAERALAPQEIGDLKKLRGGERYYRIRLGEYRIGLMMKGIRLSSFGSSPGRTFTGTSHSYVHFSAAPAK